MHINKVNQLIMLERKLTNKNVDRNVRDYQFTLDSPFQIQNK